MASNVDSAFKIAGNVIGPYIPLFKKATALIDEIVKIYETAECNKAFCDALVERVTLSSGAIETLKCRKQKNEDNFRNVEYYKAFNRFIYVLTDIKEFVADISNIGVFKKYAQAHFIKEKFETLTKNYDVAMNDLHFNIAVANEEQRRIEAEALKKDLSNMTKYFEKMDDKLVNICDEIMYIKKRIDDDNDGDKPLHGVNKINSKELIHPARPKSDDKRGKDPNFVIKKIYRGQDVACKFTKEEIETSSKTQRILEILMKLSECKYILQFYGTSSIENRNVMVFDWAERGNLRELYDRKDIKWYCKVRIALDICRGLIFLQSVNILHHDLRCENILMTESLEPKIYNFELARSFDGKTTMLDPTAGDILRWMAPEKLTNTPYTTQCEIFSFGMLLWELTFEKIPYKGWEGEKVMKHVKKGGRERITFGTSIPEIYQEEYKNIINGTWKQSPHERISFVRLWDLLDELNNSIHHMFEDNSQGLLSDKTLVSDGSKETDADFEISDEDNKSVKPVISLEEGIKAFKKKEHQQAWECFEFHAENKNTEAKYWKGRYLWEEYLDNIKGRKEEGRELLKEAADEGNSDAQLRYAFTFKHVLDEGNKQIFLEYLKKAAIEGNNSIAQFNLGDIYCKGKRDIIPKNEEEGIKWLKKAALQGNDKAINLLHDLRKSLYDDSFEINN
ncbi:kinase-like domain-containing protein [Glomus cerebriforme]|uniref:Kinase-like domain-containing protein n=1 Tax=Glomus cerebriforme TaxID=658196 RepID=A0A397TDP1_9GLOM|nr:kinase-like domain-containing protein [Glomus cerebriforme]